MQKQYLELIPKAAESGIKNIICFSGNRTPDISDEEGLEHAAAGLEPLLKTAEKEGVNIVMELLNSKVDHKGYMCDHTSWGVALCEKLGMDNFKLLYDIYHMQIMEGDIIRNIHENIEYIAHFHTAGNPGRKDLDDEQELHYVGIMNAVAKLTESGHFNGFVAHEFSSKKKDKWESMRNAVQLCDV